MYFFYWLWVGLFLRFVELLGHFFFAWFLILGEFDLEEIKMGFEHREGFEKESFNGI